MVDYLPLILWGVGTSRTIRPHWALCELGVDYETRKIIPRTESMEDPAFLAVSMAYAAVGRALAHMILRPTPHVARPRPAALRRGRLLLVHKLVLRAEANQAVHLVYAEAERLRNACLIITIINNKSNNYSNMSNESNNKRNQLLIKVRTWN